MKLHALCWPYKVVNMDPYFSLCEVYKSLFQKKSDVLCALNDRKL